MAYGSPGPASRPLRLPGPSTITGLFTLAFGVGVLTLGDGSSLDRRLWIAAVGSVAVGAGCFAIMKPHVPAGRGLLTRLGPATVVLYTLSFGLFGLAWLAPQSGSRQIIDPEQIPGAIVTSMAGLIALTMGYVVGPPRGIVRRAQRLVLWIFPTGPWSLRVPSMAVLLYLIGTGARAFRLSTGQYGYLQDGLQAFSSPSVTGQLLSVIEGFATIALVAAAVDHFMLSRSVRSRVVLICLATMEISIGVVSASKEGVLFTLVALGVVKALSGRHIRIVSVLVAGVAVSLLFPFTSEYRNTIRTGERGQIAPTEALGDIPSVIDGTARSVTARSVFVDGPSAVARRLRQVDNVAIVQQKTPRTIPYRPWTELVSGPFAAAVPRVLWPSKPVISTGREFSLDYYELPPSVYSATAVTVPGDLYRHGGLLPLAVGMAGLGLVLRFFDKAFSPSKDPRHLIIYVPVFLHLLKLESDITVFLVGMLQLLLLSAVSSWLVFVPPRKGRPRTQMSGVLRVREGVNGVRPMH